jgi:RNA polymerase sigma factor (sigma-70 family)
LSWKTDFFNQDEVPSHSNRWKVHVFDQPRRSFSLSVTSLAGGEATDATVLPAEAVRRLTDAVEKLPERLRMVLSLHYIEDLTYREIAGMPRVSEPRVCQLHSEAIGQLRKLLPEA